MNELTRQRAVVELLIAGFLWGLSFIAVRWALYGFSPYWVTTLRFLIAFATAWPVIYLLGKKESRASEAQLLKTTVIPGALLALTFVLQHSGLLYTTVTNNSFITTLYVVFVPLFDRIFYGKKAHPLLALYILLALFGAGLICQMEFQSWNVGDLLTLACAITSAFHILSIEHRAQATQSPLRFNVYQCLWGGLMMLPLAIGLSGPPVGAMSPPPIAWLGIFLLAHGVCLIAFTIQVRTQRVLPAATVSMFFLLESPIATLLAWLLLGEKLTGLQLVGGALILLSAFLTLRLPAPKK